MRAETRVVGRGTGIDLALDGGNADIESAVVLSVNANGICDGQRTSELHKYYQWEWQLRRKSFERLPGKRGLRGRRRIAYCQK